MSGQLEGLLWRWRTRAVVDNDSAFLICASELEAALAGPPPGFTTDRDGSWVPGSVYDDDERYHEGPEATQP